MDNDYNPDYVQMYGFSSSGWYEIDTMGSPSYGDGNWHHLLYTYTNVEEKIYVDGNLINTVATGGYIYQGTNTNTYIGSRAFGYPTYSGELSQIAMWSRQLNSTEIRQLYNSGAGLSLVQ
jgi:hypothetical protein